MDTNRALYDALLQRYKEIGVAGGIGSTPVSIVDRADVPSQPFSPNLMLNLLLGVVLGLTAGIAAAIALEFLNDTIDTREDVRKKLGLACLGVIPKRAGQGGLSRGAEGPDIGGLRGLFDGRHLAWLQHRARACPRPCW